MDFKEISGAKAPPAPPEDQSSIPSTRVWQLTPTPTYTVPGFYTHNYVNSHFPSCTYTYHEKIF